MEAILRKFASLDEMKAEEYRYWQSRPVHERFEAVVEINRMAYALKGREPEQDVPGIQGPIERIPCPWR